MVELTQTVRSQTTKPAPDVTADLGPTDLPECTYRCSIGRQGVYFCRHSQVHTPDQLVDTCLCRSCDQRDRECLLPRPIPSLPYQKPAASETAGPWQYISLECLVADVRRLIGQLPPEITAVAGIARSGMLPAAQIAVVLHLPLFALSKSRGLIDVGHGLRLEAADLREGPVLIVDDSVYGGAALRDARLSLRRHHPELSTLMAALYPRPAALGALDFYVRPLSEPHLFEWNLFNCNQTHRFGFDFDGIFCEDWTGTEDEGKPYEEFLRSAKPRWLPRRRAVPLIVSARLERHRQLTEAWLRRYQVRYHQLVLGQWSTPTERRRQYQAGEYKGRAYADSDCLLFIESDERQAEEIFAFARRPVLCPVTGRIFQ